MCEMTNIIKCHECDETFTENKFFGAHVRFKHGYKAQDYYDKYLASEGDGICVVCGSSCKFFSLSQGYAKTCSNKCAQLNPETRKKIESTNIKKYGVKAPAMSKDIQAKAKATNIERYGVEAPYQLESIKNKGIDTVKEKYGVENVFQLQETKEKSKKTMLEKHGVELNVLRPEVKEHIKRSKRKTKYDKFIDELSKKRITDLGDASDYINNDGDRHYACGYCDTEFVSVERQACLVRCGCLRNRSVAEYDIFDWLVSIGYEVTKSSSIYDDEGRLELDILIHNTDIGSVAIEYCGVYWHSELYRNDMYHSRKLKAANANGIVLFQVFSDEWITNQDIVKYKILDALKCNTILSEIDNSNTSVYKYMSYNSGVSKFITSNSINKHYRYGSVNYAINYGDTKTCIVNFRNDRNSSNWEIKFINNIEFINNYDIICTIIDKFINEYSPDNLYMLVDNRYPLIGIDGFGKFKLDGVSDPNIYYSPKGYSDRIHSSIFRKSKLKTSINYDTSLSMLAILKLDGYIKVCDAGCSRYIWKNNT